MEYNILYKTDIRYKFEKLIDKIGDKKFQQFIDLIKTTFRENLQLDKDFAKIEDYGKIYYLYRIDENTRIAFTKVESKDFVDLVLIDVIDLK